MCLYDITLKLFESFIEAIKSNIYLNSIEDLLMIFDFLASNEYTNTKNVRLSLDCMSIIALHLLAED